MHKRVLIVTYEANGYLGASVHFIVVMSRSSVSRWLVDPGKSPEKHPVVNALPR